MNKDFFSKERFKYIIILALFNYIFLGTEYLFDNIVGDIKPQSVVTAQSYILGASVLGFLFFAIIKKYINKKLKYGLLSAFVVVETLLFALMEYSESYGFVVITGCVMFALFGVMGSAVYYIASVYLKINRNVASTIGLAFDFAKSRTNAGGKSFKQYFAKSITKEIVIKVFDRTPRSDVTSPTL